MYTPIVNKLRGTRLDYSKLGAWMSFNQILMNGKPAPSLAACPKSSSGGQV
jgi:hypothetical protein